VIWLEIAKMKVYSISKWAFFGICALILTLPLSRHWRLITLGETAMGRVTAFKMTVHENIASEIQYLAEDSSYLAYGPEGFEYKAGRNIRLRYNPGDPSEYCLLIFSSLYFNDYFIFPLVLITVWTAFYLSFNSYSKKKRKRYSGDLAFSPYKSSPPHRATESGKMEREIEESFRQHTRDP
jgi:hypothetical protein